MPKIPRVPWGSHRLFAPLLCLALALGTPLHALATDAQPTKMPQPTLEPNAEKYDDTRPGLLAPEMLYASSAILIEASTGEVVFEKNPDEIMYPASTTKIMTALIAIQKMENDENFPTAVSISEYAGNQPSDSSTVPVSPGEEVELKDLIYGMMLRSGNDAAIAIAEHLSGSEAAFVDTMNEYAAFLGTNSTHFANSNGLHNPDHYTTARDMAIIARAAMEVKTFRDVVSTVEYRMPLTDVHPARNLTTQDSFINNLNTDNDYYFPGALGIKTGFHSQAMYCFVGAAARDGVELISVVFYSSEKGRWLDTRRLMEYGFQQFESTTPMDIYGERPRILNIAGFALSDAKNLGALTLGIRPTETTRDVRIVGRKEEIEAIKNDFSRLSQVVITHPGRAPITEGEVMGALTYFPRDGDPVEYELFATRSIEARDDAPPSLEAIQARTLADPNPFPPFSIEYVVVPVSVLLALILSLRRLRRRQKRVRKQKKRMPRPKVRSFR